MLPPERESAEKTIAEKGAVSDLVASGIFDRSPRLARLFEYLCDCYFRGEAERIKEYTIAIEALGKSSDFDPKRDSIVRVEASRLRKRLDAYYESDGAKAPVRITIPEGRYIPQFVQREAAAQEPVAEPVAAAPALPADVKWQLPRWTALLAIATVSAWILLVLWQRYASNWEPRAAASSAAVAPLELEPRAPGIRILAGRAPGKYVDQAGHAWQGDQHAVDGSTVDSLQIPEFWRFDPLYYAGRREGEFRYDIPAAAGYYELRLHFLEAVHGKGNPAGGGEASRLFGISINGRNVVEVFDVIADAGSPNTAIVKVFKDVQPDASGFVRIGFFRYYNSTPFVNAIELLPAEKGRIHPIRLVSQEQVLRDPSGTEWIPDRHATGGVLVVRPSAGKGAPVPELYQGERYGNFRYHFSVADGGRYMARMYFNEYWFGPGKSGGGGAGSRIFDVYCNHEPLLRNFDIYQQAGGTNIPLVKTFHGLKPDARGKLIFSFEPIRNYACINAIEIIDESN